MHALPFNLAFITIRISPAPLGERTLWAAFFGEGDGEPFMSGRGYGPRTADSWIDWVRPHVRLGRGKGRRLQWSAVSHITVTEDGQILIRVPVI